MSLEDTESFDNTETVPDDDPLGLGLRYRLDRSVTPERLLARFTVRPDHRGPPGYLHGGMAATILDETMACVSWALEEVPSVTARLEVRYRLPIPIDVGELQVEAWRARPGARRVQKVLGRILMPDGSVAVEATALFVEVTP